METIADRIKILIERSHLSNGEFAKMVGINKGTISKYLQGHYSPKQEQIYKIANATGCDYGWLLGIEEEPKQPADQSRVPLLGAISCGPGASMQILDDIEKPAFIQADCAFQVRGESMASKDIHDGDLVYVRKGAVRDNQIAAVRLENEYYLKTISYGPNFVALLSDLPAIFITGEQTDYEIVGEPVAVLHTL